MIKAKPATQEMSVTVGDKSIASMDNEEIKSLFLGQVSIKEQKYLEFNFYSEYILCIIKKSIEEVVKWFI